MQASTMFSMRRWPRRSAERQRTLASLWERLICAVSSSWATAARTPLNLLAAALEGGFHAGLNDVLDEALAEEVGGEAEDVGVVVGAADLRGELIVGDGGADALELVGGRPRRGFSCRPQRCSR